MTDYASLLPYATPSQAEKLQAIIEHGGARGAAKAMGLNIRTVERAVQLVRGRAAQRGHSPDHDMTRTVPDGYKVKGVSTYYDADGQVRGQWVKSQADQEQREALMREAIAAMGESIKREKPNKASPKCNTALANCYILTDFHLGMLAWGDETGDDWDTQIAEDLMVAWFSQAIRSAPNASVGILAQLGDLLHWDGMLAVTPASGHILDADTRFQKLVRVAIRALRRVVQMLLQKHERVHVIMAEGNHDPASSIWLREWFSVLYEDEPRVTVDLSPDPYYHYEHGKTSIFFHHGHKRGPDGIDDVFAAKFRDVFGRTKFSYAHLGHLHNRKVIESALMVVEQHTTLAAKDAYASRGGWLSQRSASVITYHDQHGEVGRVTITPEMVS